MPAPRMKDKVVRNPMVTFCPMDIRVNMTTEKTNTKTAQMEYSARKNASAPVNIASYVSYYTCKCALQAHSKHFLNYYIVYKSLQTFRSTNSRRKTEADAAVFLPSRTAMLRLPSVRRTVSSSISEERILDGSSNLKNKIVNTWTYSKFQRGMYFCNFIKFSYLVRDMI